jgi:hypothetical protein
MTSYIQLLNKIEAFCNAHYQIQRYGGEFREQMPNLSTESEKYPIVFVTPTGGTPMYDTNQISLDIYCVDIIQKNRANINTIVSDCHLILTDLYGYFSQGSDLSVDVIGQPSQTPLNNLDLDYVAGWMMTIVFEVDGYCVDAIPIGIIPSGGGECADASYTVEYADGTPIESGTITSGGSVTVVVPDCPTCDSATWTLTDSDGNVLDSGTIPSGGSETIVAPDATVENSDSSYSGTVASGGTLTLPDSQINVNGVDQGDVVSVKTIDVNVTDGTDPVTPDAVSLVGNTLTIEVPAAGVSPVGATLMKTGQTTSFRTGDDGDIEAGRATDFFTLGTANPFGNTRRFTGTTGGYQTGAAAYFDRDGVATTGALAIPDDVVIDWSTYDNIAGTVLGYSRLNNGVGISWDDAVDACLAYSVGAFTTGWKLPNTKELENLFCWNSSSLVNTASQFSYYPFYTTFVNAVAFWTSTTLPAATTQAMCSTSGHQLTYRPKTTTTPFQYFPCRTFTVTGTTLS